MRVWPLCHILVYKLETTEHFQNGMAIARYIVLSQLLYSQASSLTKQTTLGSPVETDGIGLHTAVPVHIRLLPAAPDTGYVFRRTDLGGFEIPATVESVAHCGYATTLMRTGVMLSTVEHLLSALRGLNVDNVYIDVDNLEIPILDGSSGVKTIALSSEPP